jgi:hypothetical protein
MLRRHESPDPLYAMPSAPSSSGRRTLAGHPSPLGPAVAPRPGSLTRPGLRRWQAGRDGAGVARRGPGPLPGRGRRRSPGVAVWSVVVQPNSAGSPTATASFLTEGRRSPSGRYGPRGGGPVTLPRESGHLDIQPPPRALPCTLSTGVSMTPVTIDSVRSFYSLRGRSHDRLARTACGSRSDLTGHPRPLIVRVPAGCPGPSHAAPPAIHGWLVGRHLGVRCGWVPGVRLAAESGVTGTLALLIIGPSVGRWQPPGCHGRPGGAERSDADCWLGTGSDQIASKDHGRLGSLWRRHGGGRGCGGSSRRSLECLP